MMTGITKDSPFEHPDGSGIRIGTRTNVVKGKRYNNSYLVVVPMKITGRQRLRKTLLVEITKTGPLEKLVWAPIKDPDNEIKTIHNRTEDPHPSGC